MNQYKTDLKTDKTNEELVELIQQGIEKEKNLELLFCKNIPFIRKFFLKNYDNIDDLDDLMQESFLAVLEASEKYDKDKGVKFLTYLVYKLRICATRKYFKSIPRNEISLETPINEEDGIYLKDIIADDEEIYEKIDRADFNKRLSKDLIDSLEDLTDLQRRLIYKKFFNNMKVKDIAEELELTPSQVQNKIRSALNVLSRKSVLKKYFDERRYCSVKGVGYNNFMRNEMSSVERTAIENIEIEKFVEEMGRTLKYYK